MQVQTRAMIVDFATVPLVDATPTNTVRGLAEMALGHGSSIYLTGTSHDLRSKLFGHRIKPPLVGYERSIETAFTEAKASLREIGRPSGVRTAQQF